LVQAHINKKCSVADSPEIKVKIIYLDSA